MDAPLARRAVDLAYAMNEAEIIAFEFAGGEPLLKFDLMRELVTYIENHPARRGRRLFLSLQTNATLLNDERATWLAGSGIQVGISLDGGAQAQNRGRPMVNGKPSHGALMRGIELLQKHGVSFGALVVLNRHNIGDPKASRASCSNTGSTASGSTPSPISAMRGGTGPRSGWSRPTCWPSSAP